VYTFTHGRDIVCQPPSWGMLGSSSASCRLGMLIFPEFYFSIRELQIPGTCRDSFWLSNANGAFIREAACHLCRHYQCRPRYSYTEARKLEQIFWASEGGHSQWAVFTASVGYLSISELRSMIKHLLWKSTTSYSPTDFLWAHAIAVWVDSSTPPIIQLNYHQLTGRLLSRLVRH